MNILYIIGNGFDLAQGMKTRYADFYPYYLKCSSPNKMVELLKKEIKENIGNWSDMELALGEFTKNVGSESELTDLYFDMSDRLSEFLQLEVKRRAIEKENKILGDLYRPYLYLEPLDRRLYLEYCRPYLIHDEKQVKVDVVTLNYTDTIEKMVSYPITVPSEITGVRYKLDTVCHLHGTLDDTILIGVNDEQQISSETFRKNQAVRDFLIKPEAITSMRSDKRLLCDGYIDNADIIVLFGVSLGATDASLWYYIVENMASENNPLLIYFHHSDEIIPKNRKQLLGRKETKARELLYERMGIPASLQSTDRILVGYNKDIFKGKG